MKTTLVLIALLVGGVPGEPVAYRVEGLPCAELVQRAEFRLSWAKDMFQGKPWVAWCVDVGRGVMKGVQ